ncbi:D-alanyl-D-alanine carboxypeptidase [Streptomyces sp. NBC_01373]|uniref:D-alanyl-D-alanine carboxypeptidase n=1 Tax=Streptomyces sp. NBC_01373 TaxID=2903843 RepID=UPI002257E9C4|nr:D-alanyl-D-alanine carboxypeptidase [Streptomyces sp. NBC_01373]MCX4700003.1 D-alanyl-D-alanine carboxypeptidase [Streptomyces sp. NBC_01373]
MEEASVAGESPDRSKQRESSAEPTSGSAGPVPEARTESPDPTEKRDPRLAVAREPSGAAATARGGVDTATRVFSVRDLTAEAENAEEAAPDTAEAKADAGTPEADAGEAKADAGEPGTEEAAQDATEAAKDAVGLQADSSEAGQDAQDATEPQADAGKPKADEAAQDTTEAEADAPKPKADEAAQDTTEAETADGPAKDAVEPQADSTDAEEAEDAAQDATEPQADAGKPEADEAAQDATEPQPDAAKPEADEAAQDTTEAGTADGPAKDAVEPQADSTDAEAGQNAEVEDGASGAGGEVGATGDVRLRDAVAAWVASADETAEAEDAAREPAQDEADAEANQTSDTGTAAPDSGTDTGTPKKGDESPGDAKPPVDQPTAVFKAVRPSAPAVDQPTTTLKLGDAAKPAGDKAESPAERTSKFVALKPLEDPATRRPAPKAPDATTALPQVTQEPKAKPPADATSSVPQVGPERTTQQPLPPRPPLDLLAELTNTPPPPETPVRTIVRRVKIWTPLVLLLAVVFAIVQAVRPLPSPELTLTADESYTFEGSRASLPWPSEGQGWMDVNGIGTMGDFGKQTPVAIGSVAKAMTAYVVLKDHPLKSGAEGPNVPVDATAEKEGGYNKDGESTLNTVKAGDKLTLRQAIAAIMIPSANNIARLLARWDAGNEADFIKKMNDAAADLGMKNTTYTDASGLKETTVSTAEDQVKLGNELVKMPALMEITSMGEWIDPSGQKVYNYNYLVPYNGAIGIKTGTTTKAGGNLLFAARKEVGGETVTLVGAILGQHKAPIIQTVNDVSKTAMLGAQDELVSAKILKKGDVVGYVDDGLGGQTPVVLTKDVTAVGWAGFKVQLSFDADDLPHTAKAGTKVGTLTVGDGSNGAVKVPVALQRDLVEPAYTDKLTRLG